MQYKLFKYLSELDKSDDLNQQIFVTTHSSNISAVAGIDNMFMLAYNRDGEIPDCRQQSLFEQFKDIEGTTFKTEAKVHLTKFLDVTRSDMLFADKVILVEGISEKMLLPLFMEICNCSYEDEHISIVEIGGKHFNYFLELYNGNAVKKDVLCITDKDFNWIDFDSDVKLKSRSDYENTEPKHIIELKRRFNFDNFHICTQTLDRRTFEDEFFLANMEYHKVAKKIFKKAVSDKTNEFIDEYGFNISKWDINRSKMDGRSQKIISKFLDAYNARKDTDPKLALDYEKLIFAEIFLHYAKGKKDDIALEILTDESLFYENGSSKLVVPNYIREGLKWFLK